MRRILKSLKSQAGSVELLMVMGMAVVGLVVMSSNLSMFDRLNQQGRWERHAIGAKNLQEEIEVFLSLEENCDATFQANPGVTNQLNSAAQTAALRNLVDPIFQVGSTTQYMNGLYTIRSWRLREEPTAITLPGNRKVVNLDIYLDKVGATIGAATVIRTIKLVATVNASNQIADCYAIKSGGTEIWVSGANPGEIVNTNLGRIGIGVQRDHVYSSKLDVVGSGFIWNDLLAGGIRADQDTVNTPAGGDVTIAASSAFEGNFVIGKAAPSPNLKLDVDGNARVTGDTVVTSSPTGTSAMFLANSIYASGNIVAMGTMNVEGVTTLNSALNPGPLYVNGKLDVTGSSTFSGNAYLNATSRYQSLTIGSTTPGPNPLHVVGNAHASTSIRSDSLETQNLCIVTNNGSDFCRTTFAQQSCPNGMITQQNEDGTVECVQPTCSGVGSYYRGTDFAPFCTTVPTVTCSGVNQYMWFANANSGTPQCRDLDPEVQVDPAPCGTDGALVDVNGGVAQCAKRQITARSCDPPMILRGVTSTGNTICDLPTTTIQCQPGEFSFGYSSTGAPICLPYNTQVCAPGQVLRGINSDGTINCGPFTLPAQTCPAGQVMTGLSTAGIISCGSVPATPTCSTIPNTSVGGLGGPASPAGCNCTVATEVFVNGQCVPNCTAANTSRNGAGGPASPSGCYCTSLGYTWVNGACVAQTETPGVCGTADGVATATAPSGSSLCNSGGASAVTDAGTSWTWTCQGVNSTDDSCSAPKNCYNSFTVFFAYAADCTGPGDDIAVTCPAGQGASQPVYGSSGSPAHCGSVPDENVWSSSQCNTCSAPTCTGGATTTPSSVNATPAGCYCASNQTWNGTTCVTSTSCTGPATGYWMQLGGSGGPLGMQGCSSVSGTVNGLCSCLGQLCSVNNNTSPPNLQCISCPSGASLSGSGGTVTGTPCECNNPGETWDGSACVGGGGGSCPAGSSPAGTISPDEGTCLASGSSCPAGRPFVGQCDQTFQPCCTDAPACLADGDSRAGAFCNFGEDYITAPAPDASCCSGWSRIQCRSLENSEITCTAASACPGNSVVGGAGVLVSGSCRCPDPSDVWDGSNCGSEVCAYSFNDGGQESVVCEAGSDVVNALGGVCPSSYTLNTSDTKTCIYNATPMTVYSCNSCGPGSNPSIGICTASTCSGGGGGGGGGGCQPFGSACSPDGDVQGCCIGNTAYEQTCSATMGWSNAVATGGSCGPQWVAASGDLGPVTQHDPIVTPGDCPQNIFQFGSGCAGYEGETCDHARYAGHGLPYGGTTTAAIYRRYTCQ